MSQYGGTVTVKGRNLVSGLIAGEELEITKVVVGSGTVPDGTDLSSMEALVAPVADATGSAPLVTDGVVSMTVEYRNDMNGGLAKDFKLSEFGIFAKEVGSDEEVLLYYAYLGDSAQPVNAYQTDRVDTKRYLVTIDLAIDPDVQIIYSPDAFVAGQMIADHIMDPDAHGGISARVGKVEAALADKAPTSHGNHVPTTQTADNAIFLRNDNTWQKVTPTNIGLGNVPNVTTNDQTPTYTQASSLSKLVSGEKLSVSMGKIMKAITDLISHLSNKSNPHGVTAAQVGAAESSHNHDASNITSGALPVARGGTGNTSVDTTPTSGSTKMVTSDGVYKALAGKAATSSYTATVTTSWTASGDYYYQDITVSGILATDTPIVDIMCGSDNAANLLYSEAMCKVFRITTSAESIRVWAKEAISIAFPIQLKVVR